VSLLSCKLWLTYELYILISSGVLGMSFETWEQ
jgi:hypothetical protein